MSKLPRRGVGIRAQIVDEDETPATPAASHVRAPIGRPPRGPDGTPIYPSRANLANGQQRAGIAAYASPAVRQWLKTVAVAENTTVNALILEAIDLLRRARGEHPFGER